MNWTWDPVKAAANVVDHDGVTFELASYVFEDDLSLSEPDWHPDGDRWRTIGFAGPICLFVVHTFPASDTEPGRIISARRATAQERRRYAEDR